uniref:ATP synthase F0 subunit 8 n=1 Tax=Panagrolaimus sp. PS1159 TaxID=55785 RepID=A0AC35GE27_9BILA
MPSSTNSNFVYLFLQYIFKSELMVILISILTDFIWSTLFALFLVCLVLLLIFIAFILWCKISFVDPELSTSTIAEQTKESQEQPCRYYLIED